jgi:tRNA pseudouridine38/39 synthase
MNNSNVCHKKNYQIKTEEATEIFFYKSSEEKFEYLLKNSKKEDLIKFVLNKQKEKVFDENEIREFFSKKCKNTGNSVETTKPSKNEEDISVIHKEKNSRLNFDVVKTFAFKFMYIGKNYDGLVYQNHTKNTVEENILNALKKAYLIQSLEKSNYSRCGRTDAGVSSTGNVFSVNLRYKPNLDYIKIINNLLPKDICVIGMAEVDNSFDARFSCLYREYKYFFIRNNMDIQKIKQACSKLEGVHNFKNFCKIDKSDPNYVTKNYERRIFEFTIEKLENSFFPATKQFTNNLILENPYYELYVATIKGSAFLWHQVRCMIGILFMIGRGLEDLNIIDNMLNINNDITYNYEIASEIPLVLSDCQYEFVHFENKKENYAESFFNISNIYQENVIQMAMNSFFLRTIVRPLKLSTEEKALEDFEKNYRRRKNYTKMLNHKTNRQAVKKSK